MKLMTVGDKLLIFLIILLSFSSILYTTRSMIKPMEKEVNVQYKGKVIANIPFNTDQQSKTYDFKFGENKGTIEVKEGQVRMLPMDKEICPNGICSDTGWIKNSYQTIVCLPNKIIVTIEIKEKQEIDIIAMNGVVNLNIIEHDIFLNNKYILLS